MSLIISSPLLIRSVSFIQSIYKSYASIKSNYSALNVLTLLKKEKIKNNPHEIKKIISLRYDISTRKLVDTEKNIFFSHCCLSFDSGYGKTNAILNFLHDSNFLPTRIKLKIDGIPKNDIGYISCDPYFSYLNKRDFKYKYPKNFLPTNINNQTSSAGELFRSCFVQEIERGAKLLIIDESIVSISAKQRTDLINFCASKDLEIPLIIVTHSYDIVKMCDHKFSM